MNKLIFVVTLVVSVSGCGGGSKSDSSDLDLDISPNFSADDGSSHTLQSTALYVDRQGIRTVHSGTFAHAVSYADYDRDGDIDVFISSGDGSEDATPAELYLNDGSGNFTLDANFFNGSPPGLVHPRKALTGDFNSDGVMDAFVIGHGYDQPPFPGEAPYVMLSTGSGFVLGSGLDGYVGFQHGGASADIDADGDIDIFVADTSESFFLINDGLGSFTKDTSRLDGLNESPLYTAELVDVDSDGYIDLLVAGQEPDGFSSKVLWGDRTGFYSVSKSTELPAVANNGTVIDIDVSDIDRDGDKDVVLNRTGDGAGSLEAYQGYYIQIIENSGSRSFLDITAQNLVAGSSSSEIWFDWIRLWDINEDGHVDIVVDDAARGLVWYNDGNGTFQK